MVKNALIIEDDRDWQNVVREPLESLGLAVAVAKSRTEAKQLLNLNEYDIVIIDIMVDEDELEIAKPKTAILITYIRQHFPNTKCAILTAFGTLDFAIGAFRQLGVVDFYVKDSFNVIEFMKSIKELLALGTSGEPATTTIKPSPTADSIFNIELERRKRELITQINNYRKESDDILVTIKNKRIAAKGNKTNANDDEWINQQRSLLDERYQNALIRINNINSLKEVASEQLWLEKECNDWLSLSAK